MLAATELQRSFDCGCSLRWEQGTTLAQDDKLIYFTSASALETSLMSGTTGMS